MSRGSVAVVLKKMINSLASSINRRIDASLSGLVAAEILRQYNATLNG
jgi:hypothetical protein